MKKKKNQKMAWIMIFICVLILGGLAFLTFKENNQASSYKKIFLEFKNTKKTYEIGSKLNAVEFIKKTNAVDVDYPIIKTDEVGEHAFVYIAYDNQKNKKEYVLTLVFVDAIKPILTLTTNADTVYKGDPVNLKTYVKEAYDPVDGKLNVSIKKEKNWKGIGKHKITYSITDQHGNTVTAVLELTIQEKPKEEEKPADNGNNAQNGSNGAILPNPQPSLPQYTAPSSLPAKTFLFTEGYTMPQGANPADSACLIYKGANNGSCVSLRGPDGLFIGMEYVP